MEWDDIGFVIGIAVFVIIHIIAVLYVCGIWPFSVVTSTPSNNKPLPVFNTVGQRTSGVAVVANSMNTIHDGELSLGLKILGRGSLGLVAVFWCIAAAVSAA